MEILSILSTMIHDAYVTSQITSPESRIRFTTITLLYGKCAEFSRSFELDSLTWNLDVAIMMTALCGSTLCSRRPQGGFKATWYILCNSGLIKQLNRCKSELLN